MSLISESDQFICLFVYSFILSFIDLFLFTVAYGFSMLSYSFLGFIIHNLYC